MNGYLLFTRWNHYKCDSVTQCPVKFDITADFWSSYKTSDCTKKFGTVTISILTKIQFHQFYKFLFSRKNFPHANVPEQRHQHSQEHDNVLDIAKTLVILLL